MCQPANCRTCAKTTWSGCGQHVDQVMRTVPKNGRCTCNGGTRQQGDAKPGLMSRLWGR